MNDFEAFSEIEGEYGELATAFKRLAEGYGLDLNKLESWWEPWSWFLRGADWEETLLEIEFEEE